MSQRALGLVDGARVYGDNIDREAERDRVSVGDVLGWRERSRMQLREVAALLTDDEAEAGGVFMRKIGHSDCCSCWPCAIIRERLNPSQVINL